MLDLSIISNLEFMKKSPKLGSKLRSVDRAKGKEKKKKKPDEAEIPKGLSETKARVIVAMGGLAFVGLVLSQVLSKDSSTTPEPTPVVDTSKEKPPLPPQYKIKTSKVEPLTTFKNGNEFEQKIEFQEHWKVVALDAIKMFKDADPRMPQIIKYMEKHAFYTIPMGPTVTQRVMRGGVDQQPIPDINEFEIVFMPEIYAREMPASILTENSGKTMRIAANFKIKEWLGIILAHEMSHIYDLNVNKENPFDSKQYFAGEVKAHSLENNLLKAWNPEIYAALMEKGIQLYKEKRYKELINLIETSYPVKQPFVSANESSLGCASAVMAVAFEEARQRGASHHDLEKVYQYVLDTFSKPL